MHSLLALLGASMLAANPVAPATQGPHAPVLSLDLQARESWRNQRPIVLMFSLPGCRWCDALRREHLNGLAAHQETLQIRFLELDMSERRPFLKDGEPEPSGSAGGTAWWQLASPADCARALGVRMAPTVLFMGPDGEVAERLVGYGSPDFYGAYLEQRMTQARNRLKPTKHR
jgi:thioredoxin-related protein